MEYHIDNTFLKVKVHFFDCVKLLTTDFTDFLVISVR